MAITAGEASLAHRPDIGDEGRGRDHQGNQGGRRKGGKPGTGTHPGGPLDMPDQERQREDTEQPQQRRPVQRAAKTLTQEANADADREARQVEKPAPVHRATPRCMKGRTDSQACAQ